MIWKIAIVGAGPAGIAAACEAARLGVRPLLLESDRPGGTIRVAHEVRNLPFLASDATGECVAEHLERFLVRWGIHSQRAQVTGIRYEDGRFTLDVHGGATCEAERVVLAMGTEPLFPPIEGLGAGHPRFVGSAPEAYRSGPLDDVVVIGGSDVAMDQARWLRARGARVEVLARGRLRAPDWLAEAARQEGVTVSVGVTLSRASPSDCGFSLVLRQNGDERERRVDAIVSAIGRRAVTVAGMETVVRAHPRLVRVVGDGTGRRARHVVAALGDGCVAAAELLARPAGGCG